jgi:hypothetical protein
MQSLVDLVYPESVRPSESLPENETGHLSSSLASATSKVVSFYPPVWMRAVLLLLITGMEVAAFVDATFASVVPNAIASHYGLSSLVFAL